MGNVGGSIHEMRTGGTAATTIAPASPRNDSQQTKAVKDQTASNSDPGSRLLPPPPSPLTLRQRFPSILRKTDSLPSPTHTALSAPPPSSLSQRSTQSTVGPRPPLPSRPLPPHRLIHSSVRAVPPHRLIKSLPLPAVPPPRPPKPFVNTDGSNTDVSEDVTNFEQQPNSSQLQRNEKDSVVENSDTLMSEDTEALRILAAVSEAAAAAVPNSLGQSQSKRNLTNNGDDDEEFEEEL
ncbi:unnamed protein product [Angiostrongylus costaricensis]|uniref:WH2 domain-containing protein n=1 Tax=Angiostrongylus costaricensis TaxID=334426 RepID=A0A0R3PHU3_ANGCS|nr:unnamed protein product [Angiostrongylus costaricensis]